MLEIIVETLADALAAEDGGATQLDLKSALPMGGLTPSAGMIEQVCRGVHIPVLVMIRPHARSFSFSNAEVAVMCGDILTARKLGADAFLTGCLTKDLHIDVEGVKALQEAAGALPIHFHLAWEMTSDPDQALGTLIELGVQSVRVSGGGTEGRAFDGMTAIKRYARLAEGRIELVLAGGVSLESIPQLVQGSVVSHVHVGRAARTPQTQYGSVDANAVRELAEALDRAVSTLRSAR